MLHTISRPHALSQALLRPLSALLAGLLLLASTPAVAQEPVEEPPQGLGEAGEAPNQDKEASTASLGLTLDLGYASAYLFRGYNVFQGSSQMDQHMLLAPGVYWSVFDTGLSIGYLGSFQFTGDNVGDVIDIGLGAEQDFFASYGFTLTDELALSVGVTAYLYPLADEAIVGASSPLYLEPGVTLSFSHVVDAALFVGYFLGIQDQPAIRGISYLYINPSVSKSLELTEMLSLGLKLGYGFKLFQEGNDGMSNIHDLALTVNLPIPFASRFYVTPGLSAGWTNLEGKDFADGIVALGSLNLGVEL